MTTTNDNEPNLKQLLVALLLTIVMIVIMFVFVPMKIIVLGCFVTAILFALYETFKN